MKLVQQRSCVEKNIRENIDRTTDITVAEIRQLSSFANMTEDEMLELIAVVKEFTSIVFNSLADGKELATIVPINRTVTNIKAA